MIESLVRDVVRNELRSNFGVRHYFWQFPPDHQDLVWVDIAAKDATDPESIYHRYAVPTADAIVESLKAKGAKQVSDVEVRWMLGEPLRLRFSVQYS